MTSQDDATTRPDLTRGIPAGFVWGAATASFQIEGDAAGRGDSIWDALCREPGRIRDGSDGLVACDHVARYREDVGLMRDLGLGAYRFSISWPRVQPGGRGPLAAPGLAFYDRLLDELLDAGIDPWVTLYHWDLPTPLQEAGGWPARDVVEWFTDYATAVHAAFGDRVRHWATLNEPWCSAWLGYGVGVHAPGIADTRSAVRAAHHLLLAHGSAVAAMRQQAPADHMLGIVLNPGSFLPAAGLDPGWDDVVAHDAQLMDGVQSRWWLDALLLGQYPADTVELLAPHLDDLIGPDDLATIAQPLDFLGINYYSQTHLVPAPGAGSGRHSDGTADHPVLFPGAESVVPADPGPDATTMGWAVTPDGLRALLERIATQYPPIPLVVTENGAAYDDDPAVLEDGAADAPIPDPRRVSYLRRHVAAVAQACEAGVDVRGYFAWSLLDNFEWAEGYTQRFGLVRVDFATGERRVRESYTAYRDLIGEHRAGRSAP